VIDSWSSLFARYKNARLNLFYRVMPGFSEKSRKTRMKRCAALLRLDRHTSIIDLGGQPTIWNDIAVQLDITILNLAGVARTDLQSHHQIRYIVGDACQVSAFSDKQFDVVFSNSVIEHVGGPQKRARP
jgi:methyltransferase family protein